MTTSFLYQTQGKNDLLKKQIITQCINEGDLSLADISKNLTISIPTATKLVSELIDEGYLKDMGKIGTNGGRRPNIYGLNSAAGYFVGVDIKIHHINIAIVDFKGELVDFIEDVNFTLVNSIGSFEDFCNVIKDNLDNNDIEHNHVLAYGINFTGRVNNSTGYCFSYYIGENTPITEILENNLGCPVFIENDSRAMTYGEYMCGAGQGEKNFLFINVTWGLGMGMILDGQLSYGKSGFSGEIGHFPLLSNNQICQCGKIGCLETGASGSALHRIFIEKIRSGQSSILSGKYNNDEDISLEDILGAVFEEDMLAIECVEEIGATLGRAIAGLINLFNPETIVIGGILASAKDYLLIPIKGAINKHSLNIVSKDTHIKTSKLGKKCGAIGACMLSRSKLLNLI
ncbi:MAG: ROK family protein [Bacteroidales bacterium]|nr:ROK family protein [Bacteroidales bacterium]